MEKINLKTTILRDVDVKEIEDLLNTKSGLLVVSGRSREMLEYVQRAYL